MGDSGQLGNQEEPHDLNRKGLLSQGSNSIAMKSRVNREVQARFCERLEVRPLRPTRPATSRSSYGTTLSLMSTHITARLLIGRAVDWSAIPWVATVHRALA